MSNLTETEGTLLFVVKEPVVLSFLFEDFSVCVSHCRDANN